MMNRRAIVLLAAGHFLIDLCQGTVPALLPFLVAQRQFSYTAAASLVFAISASSSVVQPFFGQVADRLALAWLLPASILLTGEVLPWGLRRRRLFWCCWRSRSVAWESRPSTRRLPARLIWPAAIDARRE